MAGKKRLLPFVGTAIYENQLRKRRRLEAFDDAIYPETAKFFTSKTDDYGSSEEDEDDDDQLEESVGSNQLMPEVIVVSDDEDDAVESWAPESSSKIDTSKKVEKGDEFGKSEVKEPLPVFDKFDEGCKNEGLSGEEEYWRNFFETYGSMIIDSNGFLLGDFRRLDEGLSIL